ncbi:unnamed protein product [Vitrella brassicaformis CCMP3155]|uniref:Cytochrome c domain-containing protein n=1 Tax=Vitrella brassicaformis (strain CCMP3155) TaxID=1169540 RepID=A0A0G4EE20_VITBC|nr:unnamed protein product [Vitrella brassicaformis CCMP3155]|mmetsp:Transcript_49600/g.124366  ORF Transcript_49600/g.124366 Transcript_49600/m.124366 type:complete len:384 (-) Transcript_49600:983-2134(-)|eukprot:CEL93579.1 unnamed protein product [Vitrella brassicaformis CCMP3155]
MKAIFLVALLLTSGYAQKAAEEVRKEPHHDLHHDHQKGDEVRKEPLPEAEAEKAGGPGHHLKMHRAKDDPNYHGEHGSMIIPVPEYEKYGCSKCHKLHTKGIKSKTGDQDKKEPIAKQSCKQVRVKVCIENRTNGSGNQPMSPPLIHAASRSLGFYNKGVLASDSETRGFCDLAEDGVNSEAAEWLRRNVGDLEPATVDCGVLAAEDGIAPGDTACFELRLSCECAFINNAGVNVPKEDVYVNVAQMQIITNDNFWAAGDILITRENGNDFLYEEADASEPPFQAAFTSLDAGCEINNELCTHIPRSQCLALDACSAAQDAETCNALRAEENGEIDDGQCITGEGAGNKLSPEIYGCPGEVASMTIEVLEGAADGPNGPPAGP